jgi:hypothetical protein
MLRGSEISSAPGHSCILAPLRRYTRHPSFFSLPIAFVLSISFQLCSDLPKKTSLLLLQRSANAANGTVTDTVLRLNLQSLSVIQITVAASIRLPAYIATGNDDLLSQ